MLLPSPDRARRSGGRGAAVVVVVAGRDRGHVAGAIALASRRRGSLHLVAPAPAPWSPWAVLLGVRPAGGGPVAELITQATAAGVHVEVHRTPWRLNALAAGIAETVGGEVVGSGSRQSGGLAGRAVSRGAGPGDVGDRLMRPVRSGQCALQAGDP